jgi:biotin operon repressor
MPRRAAGKRRQTGQISLGRAARLFTLIGLLGQAPASRESLLKTLGIGLRTYYRELQLLKKCGIRVSLSKKLYHLHMRPELAQGRLPFPDPKLSFAEIQELVTGQGPAALRLLELLNRVTGRADGLR